MPPRTAIFVDGGYLDHVLRACNVFGKVDYGAFFRELGDGTELLRAYYYHCLPYQSATPTEEEARRFGQMERFLAAIDRIPRTEVRKGMIAFRGVRDDGKPIFVQKQVDSLMATDLVMLSAKHLISEAVIVTGDSDILPAIAIAKQEGVMVRLAHGTNNNYPHRMLWDQCDERVALTRSSFNGCLQPTLPPAGEALPEEPEPAVVS